MSTRCMNRSHLRSTARAAFRRSQTERHPAKVREPRRFRSLRATRRALLPPCAASVHAIHAALSLTFRILASVFLRATLSERLSRTRAAHVSKKYAACAFSHRVSSRCAASLLAEARLTASDHPSNADATAKRVMRRIRFKARRSAAPRSRRFATASDHVKNAAATDLFANRRAHF